MDDFIDQVREAILLVIRQGFIQKDDADGMMEKFLRWKVLYRYQQEQDGKAS